jgi:DNA-binding Lrp family transcriptional regulator
VTAADRDQFIERMGLAAESDGLSRIAGRLFGALLLADHPRSLDDLAEQLAVSKASVSTEARRLLDRGVAERVGKTGDRRDYYTLTPDFFTSVIRFRLGRWESLHRLARNMQGTAVDQPKVVRDRLAYIDAVQAFVLARMEDALRDWALREQHQPRSGRAPAARTRSVKQLAKRQTGADRLG